MWCSCASSTAPTPRSAGGSCGSSKWTTLKWGPRARGGRRSRRRAKTTSDSCSSSRPTRRCGKPWPCTTLERATTRAAPPPWPWAVPGRVRVSRVRAGRPRTRRRCSWTSSCRASRCATSTRRASSRLTRTTRPSCRESLSSPPRMAPPPPSSRRSSRRAFCRRPSSSRPRRRPSSGTRPPRPSSTSLEKKKEAASRERSAQRRSARSTQTHPQGEREIATWLKRAKRGAAGATSVLWALELG
mmetsp:Transcript_66366/g.149865  ORF Transcript_66366/g.149865 Transcript_66366/m.149865 type:complete len:243 (+) Transcript_66366:458-1186(+)